MAMNGFVCCTHQLSWTHVEAARIARQPAGLPAGFHFCAINV